MRAFHRKALTRAYEEGLAEHIAGTAWDSALDWLRDIVTVYEEGHPLIPALSFVDPWYAEALAEALGASRGLRAVWLGAMTVASAESHPYWRASAAFVLVRTYGTLDAQGRKLLASVAVEEAAREEAPLWLSLAYDCLTAQCQKLIASLAADTAVGLRPALADALAENYENVDAAGRELLEQVRASIEDE